MAKSESSVENSMAKRKAQLVDKKELAKALGTSIRNIARWQEEGMPVAQRGKPGKASLYDLEACRAWRDQHFAVQGGATAASLAAQERARKERAQALLAEQAYAMRAGQLLPREEVQRIWEAELTTLRNRLLAWPTVLADRLHQAALTEGVDGVEAALNEAVRDALKELSDEERPLPPKDEPPGEAQAA